MTDLRVCSRHDFNIITDHKGCVQCNRELEERSKSWASSIKAELKQTPTLIVGYLPNIKKVLNDQICNG